MKSKIVTLALACALLLGITPTAKSFDCSGDVSASDGAWYLGYTNVTTNAYWSYDSADLSAIVVNGGYWHGEMTTTVGEAHGDSGSGYFTASNTESQGVNWFSTSTGYASSELSSSLFGSFPLGGDDFN